LDAEGEGSTVTLTTLMQGYANRGDSRNAQRVFSMIKKPDVITYNTLLLAYSNVPDVKGAQDVFEHMSLTGVAPTNTTYNVLMGLHARHGRVLAAEKILREMNRCGKTRPTAVTFNKLMQAYLRNGNKAGAGLVMQRMIRFFGQDPKAPKNVAT